MSLDMVSEIWKILNQYLPNKIEQQNAADEVISFLVDNDFSVDDIKAAFDGEPLFLKMLKSYDKEEVEYDDSYDEEEEWDDDENYGNVEW